MVAHFIGGPLHGTDRDVGSRSYINVYSFKHATAKESLEARTDNSSQYVDPTIEECVGEYRRLFKGDSLSKAFGTGDLPSVFVWME